MVISILNNKEGQQCDGVGDHYTTRFLRRHSHIDTTIARAMDRDQALAVNAKSLDEYFERLSECIARNHIDPGDMWNFDEKGFMMGGRGGKKNELVSSRVRVKAPPANATRKSGIDYVDRMCFGNWKKTTRLLYLCRNGTLGRLPCESKKKWSSTL
jgi:hypothetical protein